MAPSTFLSIFAGRRVAIPQRYKVLAAKPRRVQRLLATKKARLGIEKDALVFLGASNLAHYHWCAMQSVLRSRMGEQSYFLSYLHDRLGCASALGLPFGRIRSDEDLLDAVEEISAGRVLRLIAPVRTEPDTKPNPRLDSAIDGLSDPRVAGLLLQLRHAEKYPTIRWAFPWEGYVVCGVPDGITGDFVYEFKSTGSEYLSGFQQPVAFAQADIYGRLFRRSTKRVQIFLRDEARTQTWTTPVDKKHALNTIRSFRSVESGTLPPLPDAPWKCRKCPVEIRSRCPIVR
jgi:hypothetical protein